LTIQASYKVFERRNEGALRAVAGDRKAPMNEIAGVDTWERRVRYGELNLARSLGIAVIWLENEYNFGVTA
jgi:hypothetical protein